MSSLWLISLCIGSFVGAGLGSVTFDQFGFSWSCSIEAIIIGISVSYFFILYIKVSRCQSVCVPVCIKGPHRTFKIFWLITKIINNQINSSSKFIFFQSIKIAKIKLLCKKTLCANYMQLVSK